LDTPLRELAAEALGAIGPAAAPAVPRLVALLEDDSAFSDYVRARIPRALARIGDPVAIPALIAAARDPDGQGPGERAIIALGMFGAAARPALPSLLQLLSDPRCAPATATILGALARIDPAAGPAWDALLGALDAARDPRERAMYAHGLYRLTCGSGGPARPAAQATFARLAADPDPEVARTAALALKVLGRKSKIKRI
ncbi:MAG TPA: HEAT repeat domain-containing protein, partial [Herpetosiphonaceae bacterium]|nr:HEAT repeat domain-containing protein [Herpetosiphonaceae bacterium]